MFTCTAKLDAMFYCSPKGINHGTGAMGKTLKYGKQFCSKALLLYKIIDHIFTKMFSQNIKFEQTWNYFLNNLQQQNNIFTVFLFCFSGDYTFAGGHCGHLNTLSLLKTLTSVHVFRCVQCGQKSQCPQLCNIFYLNFSTFDRNGFPYFQGSWKHLQIW